MRIRRTWIDIDRGGRRLSKRSEVLTGESGKRVTAKRARKLIEKTYPQHRVRMVPANPDLFRWLAISYQVDQNRWRYACADPLDEESLKAIDEYHLVRRDEFVE
jgi:hypothetical protein